MAGMARPLCKACGVRQRISLAAVQTRGFPVLPCDPHALWGWVPRHLDQELYRGVMQKRKGTLGMRPT